MPSSPAPRRSRVSGSAWWPSCRRNWPPRQAPEQARAAAAKLADPRTVAIVTGQQAGLFGGPLYTLMKGLTAARLAADIEAQFGVPCVTVFWNHAEDHDWEEVASAWVLDERPRSRIV